MTQRLTLQRPGERRRITVYVDPSEHQFRAGQVLEHGGQRWTVAKAETSRVVLRLAWPLTGRSSA